MEAFLHYIWARRLWARLIPMGGLRDAHIEVIDPGVLNHHAGPDFFGAKIQIDDLLWVGCVEIHHASSQWYQHGHDEDPAYRSVILHVVELDNRAVQHPAGEEMPTCLLMIPEALPREPSLGYVGETMLPGTEGLRQVSEDLRRTWLACLYRARLGRKAGLVEALRHRSSGDWGQALYALFVRYLGFGLNNDAMERLAFRLPLHLLQKHRDQLLQLEALLLGTAGLLGYLPEGERRERCRQEFAFLQHKYSLEPLPAGTFRRARTRPTNLPEYRLLQLASLLTKVDLLGEELQHVSTLQALHRLLHHPLDEAWCGGKWRGDGGLSLGACASLAINALLPYRRAWRVAYQELRDEPSPLQLIESLPAEENHVTRLFAETGLTPRTVLESQALLELHEGYCLRDRCSLCPFAGRCENTPS